MAVHEKWFASWWQKAQKPRRQQGAVPKSTDVGWQPWESRGPGYNSDTYISMMRRKHEQEADGSRDRNPCSDSHVHRGSFSQEPIDIFLRGSVLMAAA